jgi:hypothetical protein
MGVARQGLTRQDLRPLHLTFPPVGPTDMAEIVKHFTEPPKQNRRPVGRRSADFAIDLRALRLRRAGADLLLLAGVLDVVDLADLLLMQLAVAALYDFDQILIHDDVAGLGVD